jgi:hypothetical protein
VSQRIDSYVGTVYRYIYIQYCAAVCTSLPAYVLYSVCLLKCEQALRASRPHAGPFSSLSVIVGPRSARYVTLYVDCYSLTAVSVTPLLWNTVHSVRRLFPHTICSDQQSYGRHNTDFLRGFIATRVSCEISTSLQRQEDSTRRRKTTGRPHL